MTVARNLPGPRRETARKNERQAIATFFWPGFLPKVFHGTLGRSFRALGSDPVHATARCLFPFGFFIFVFPPFFLSGSILTSRNACSARMSRNGEG